METVQFHSINIKQLLEYKGQSVEAIANLNIPNIIMPQHLLSKKRTIDESSSTIINIRGLFGALNDENSQQVIKRLREIIIAEAQTVSALHEIANEFLQQFMVGGKFIKGYLKMLNSIHDAAILTEDKSDVSGKKMKISETIGNCFLSKCRDTIFSKVSLENIISLAALNTDDADELDKYSRERDTIMNLITTICYLYEQRKTNYIRLTAVQIYSVMKRIIDSYKKSNDEMTNLGNPYEGDCVDEERYLLLERTCTLYAEQLYIFLSKCLSTFLEDPTPVRIAEKEHKLADLVDTIRKEIIPTLTEPYLVNKYAELKV